jgi:NTP pyrophosphatase (non-canonical NTP hydrolase)
MDMPEGSVLETCTFNEAKELVRKLVAAKGFPNDESALAQKLLWAFVELGEAADAYKKGADWDTVNEELIDTIFYILDFIGIVEKTKGIDIDVDHVFLQKWRRNMERPEHYGQTRDLKVNSSPGQ